MVSKTQLLLPSILPFCVATLGSRIVTLLLSLNFCQNFSKDLIFGPIKCLGLGIKDLYIMQEISHLVREHYTWGWYGEGGTGVII